MRTTLTLDDDLADALKQQAKLLDVPFKQVVNDTLRRGLAPEAPENRPVFRVRPLRGGFRPGIDPLKLNQLNDQLEVEEFLEDKRMNDMRCLGMIQKLQHYNLGRRCFAPLHFLGLTLVGGIIA